MNFYSIGEACRLLGVKPHVLRYWEQEIPLLSPRKDSSGKRVYGENDLHVLFRIRYLIYQERLTLEGVKLRLWREMEEGDPNLRGRINQIRGEALVLYRIIQRQKKKGSCFRNTGPPADNNHNDTNP